MSTESDNRSIEILFEDEMPGYRCIVSRQLDGAINLQFENVNTRTVITVPAQDATQWDSPQKLHELCAQLSAEFLLVSNQQGARPASKTKALLDHTRNLADRIYLCLKSHGRK
ncbi:hypothetical protein [Pseudomonas sp. LFM046]|uniref:hypothetical protein n=1 Tax=Pseudomonas sp. LFM046 TaxID=1608357 RepID=UPI0005CFA48E|nr:hypothetical protein [Pseudomonas sp. LFM046]